jgi:hypothetical protein
MKLTEYIYLTGEDITEKAREREKTRLLSKIGKENTEELLEMFGSDPYDFGRPNADEVAEAINMALDKSMTYKLKIEAELEVNL